MSAAARRIAAPILLGLGVLALAGAHVTKTDSGDSSSGWEIWPAAVDFVRSGEFGRQIDRTVGFTSFFTLALMVTSAPWVIPFLRRSRILKTLYAVLSALGAGAMIYFLVEGGDPNPFLALLAIAPLLTLTGTLLVPSEARELPPS